MSMRACLGQSRYLSDLLIAMKLMLSPYLLLKTLIVIPAIALSLVSVPTLEVMGESPPLSTTQSQKLTLGKTFTRSIQSGESHEYAIALEKGQFFHAVVNQEGVDVKVSLLGRDRKVIQTSDSPNGLSGPEPMSFIVEESGVYGLRVEQLAEAPKGNYSLMLKERRMTVKADLDRIKAERAFMAANQLALTESLEDKQEALEKYQTALPVFQMNKNQYAETLTLNQIGGIYDVLGEKENALSFYKQALPLRKAVSDRLGEANTLNNIAKVYNALGEKEKAISFYTQALPILREVGDRSGEANTLSTIGLVHDSLGEKEKAISFYTQALPILKEVGDRPYQAVIYNQIGVTIMH